MPHIHFLPDDIKVEIKEGESIRDAALHAGVPMAHVCKGKGRCSTCRIVVLEGLENCSPRTDKEKIITEQLMFPSEVRLACQTTLKDNAKVRRLTLDEYDVNLTSKFIMGEEFYLAGVEKYVFVMFVDIRGFTAFSESLLPYDVIHVLHRFFYVMNDVIMKNGGYIDNYLGDGFMALFEVENPEEGSISAVRTGLEMLQVLKDQIKPYVEKLFGKTIEIRIGLHYGLVVAGTIGGIGNKKTTVIGDAVNFASRIESANKQMGTEFLISQDTYDKLANKVQINRKIQIKIPGKKGVQTLYEVTGLKE
jgi:adenylate cyclase